jgi:hypothetical protein
MILQTANGQYGLPVTNAHPPRQNFRKISPHISLQTTCAWLLPNGQKKTP